LDGAPSVPGGVPYLFLIKLQVFTQLLLLMPQVAAQNPALLVIIGAGPGVSGTATPTATTCPTVRTDK